MPADGIRRPTGKAEPVPARVHITDRPSPNFGPRRDGLTPEFVVIHYTAMASAAAACARLCSPDAEVSAHYLISMRGDVIRLVDEPCRAWHAGAGEWHGLQDINSRSIGIELDNAGTHPFAEPQMAALETLLAGILQRWRIPPDGVIGHSDMAPGRKQDPGPHFDWARLAHAGLAGRGGDQSGTPGCDEDAFRAAAAAAGFTAPVPLADLLASTRLRYAPWRSGPLVAADFNLSHMRATS